MSINNYERLTNKLVEWCRAKANEAGVAGATVGVSGGVDSAVVLAICARAFPGRTVGVMMPCGSSQSSKDRAEELFDAVGRDKVSVSLINLNEAFYSITSQWSEQGVAKIEKENQNFVYGGLRSCLRAPVLDFVAKATNSLVFGTGNRDEDLLFRYYQKRGDGAVDNNALVGLHKTEVWDLAKYLGVPASIINAKPTADLWGGEEQLDEDELGITYKEIEWATRELDRQQQANTIPTLVNWQFEARNIKDVEALGQAGVYNEREVYLLTRAIKAEIATRHKTLPPPGLDRLELLREKLVS